MLRDLSLVELSVLAGVCAQCGDEAAKISIASNLPEAACDLQDSGSDPALEHCAVTPALDVAHVVHDQGGSVNRCVKRIQAAFLVGCIVMGTAVPSLNCFPS